MQRETLFSFHGFRYLKLALGLVVLSGAAYLWDQPPVGGPSGSTWLGYTLGTLGALLIVWLLLLGARKRAYRSNLGTVRGWLSAHVYLGLALAFIATLHTGFKFDFREPNVHILAYVLMMAVIASGIWGVGLYFRNPQRLSDVLNNRSLAQLLDNLLELDGQSRVLAADLGDEFPALVDASSRAEIATGRRVGPFAAWGRLRGTPRRCTTTLAVEHLQQASLGGDPVVRELFALQVRRLRSLQDVRDFVRIKAWTDFWLLLHVPLSFACLAALIAHVVVVFVYW